MDDVLCNYTEMHLESLARFPELKYPQSRPGAFLNLNPVDGAIQGFCAIFGNPKLDVYILSAPSVLNPHSYTEKRLWVEQHLGLDAAHKLILSSHKNLNHGDFLIDDYTSGKGQESFRGELLHFGSDRFPDWLSIVDYLEIKTGGVA